MPPIPTTPQMFAVLGLGLLGAALAVVGAYVLAWRWRKRSPGPYCLSAFVFHGLTFIATFQYGVLNSDPDATAAGGWVLTLLILGQAAVTAIGVAAFTLLVFGAYLVLMGELDYPVRRTKSYAGCAVFCLAFSDFRVSAGESVYLEPLLEPLPLPAPTSKQRPVFTPMTFSVQRQNKYLLFNLQGSSGDSRTFGSVTVSLNGPANNTVTGNLNGQPCQIELVKLENIAEASIVEAPGPANSWSSMVVRVRPKDEKRRPISFAINWRSLPNAPPVNLDAPLPGFFTAQAIRKVQPEYPSAARGSKTVSSVLVLVKIDADGSVISATAIEGPVVFRTASEDAARKWKFRPATRNGQATESEMVIQFRFEP